MIRAMQPEDIERVLDIWLSASLIAHHFVDARVWRSGLADMRSTYLPASDNFVFVRSDEIAGFYALKDSTLAALFVAPEIQRQGIGRQLLDHAKGRRPTLDLCVFRQNGSSLQFYLSQGFSIVREQTNSYTGHQELFMTYSRLAEEADRG